MIVNAMRDAGGKLLRGYSVHPICDGSDNVISVEVDDQSAEFLAANGTSTADVDAARDARLAAGYADATTGKTYQADEKSRGFLNAVGAAAGILKGEANPPSFEIIASDNSVVTLVAADAFALIQGRIMPWVSATVFHARDLKNQLLAGQAIDINAGWP